jgi:hypothetical protein
VLDDGQEDIDVLKDLLKFDMLKVIRTQFIDDDPDRKKYGYLPIMATHSRGSIGTLLSSSFAERINSAANIVMGKDNTLLDPKTVNMLVVLRMNRSFMEKMRKKHKGLSRQKFNQSTVTEVDNIDDEAEMES